MMTSLNPVRTYSADIFVHEHVVVHDYSRPKQSDSPPSASIPTVVVSPLALHDAALADLAPRYSLMEALQTNGIERLSLIEWISASAQSANYTIDAQLQLLDQIVNHHGTKVNLIGLCQGGWLSLIYTALFPHKVRRLVMAGAPVDFHAHLPRFLRAAREMTQSLSWFGRSLAVDYWTNQWGLLAQPIVHGRDIRWLWPYDLERDWNIEEALQISKSHPPEVQKQAINALKGWDERLLDLPAPYFWQVVQWLYRDNRLAEGTLYALDRRVDLHAVICPIYLLAGENDRIVSVDQVLATIALVGTPPDAITLSRAPCGHLALFMGHQTLTHFWPPIAQWLHE